MNRSGTLANKLSNKRVQTILLLHGLINALFISLIALNHDYVTQELRLYTTLQFDYYRFFCLVFIESLLLTLPGFLVGTGIAFLLKRTGLLIGLFLIAITPLIYYIDLTSHLTLNTRLFSLKTYKILSTMSQVISEFGAEANYSTQITEVAIYLVVEFVAIVSALFIRIDMSASKSRLSRKAQMLIAGIAALLLLAPFAEWVKNPVRVRTLIVELPDRHPIYATGIIEYALSPNRNQQEALQQRLAVHCAKLQPVFKKFEQKLRTVKLIKQPTQTPDILIFLTESLRYDAITPKSAPNLHQLSNTALTSQLHLSSGNCSENGFFALFNGIDSIFFTQAFKEKPKYPVLLPKLLKEAGYYCAAAGRKGIVDYGFVSPEYYDHIYKNKIRKHPEADSDAIAHVQKILQREGEFAHLKNRPVCVILYLFTTHFDYQSKPEDIVFEPTYPVRPPAPPYKSWDKPKIRNRYLNSVHCYDRLIAPLLKDENRIHVVLGDHGESLGEDGSAIHGTKLSTVQIRTPLIIKIPGVEPRQLDGPTQHQDILVTLLDAIGAQVNYPEIFSGRSLLRAEDLTSRVLSVRGHLTKQTLLFSLREEENSPFMIFRLDLLKPACIIENLCDEMEQSTEWNSSDAARFERTYIAWLEEMLNQEVAEIPKSPVPALIAALESEYPSVRQAAIEICRQWESSAKAAFPALKKCLKDEDPTTRKLAAEVARELRLSIP